MKVEVVPTIIAAMALAASSLLNHRIAEGQTVIVNDMLQFTSERIAFGVESDYIGWICQTSPICDDTAVFFDYDGTSLTAVNTLIDEGSDWYVVNPGDRFGPRTIQRREFKTIISLEGDLFDWLGNPVFVGSGDFYLGVATGEELCYEEPCDDVRDVFGWVHLENVDGKLEMLDNAVAYGSAGIIVGTTMTIPEPSTIICILIGTVVVRCNAIRRAN